MHSSVNVITLLRCVFAAGGEGLGSQTSCSLPLYFSAMVYAKAGREDKPCLETGPQGKGVCFPVVQKQRQELAMFSLGSS